LTRRDATADQRWADLQEQFRLMEERHRNLLARIERIEQQGR